MKALRILLSLIVMIFYSVMIVSPAEAYDCSITKYGLYNAPLNPNDYNKDSRPISTIALNTPKASYVNNTTLDIYWSRWGQLDEATETLFYDKYLLYYSNNKGSSWSCVAISTARYSWTLEKLLPNSAYDFAFMATDGVTWAKPVFFSGNTDPSRKPIELLCLPDAVEANMTFSGNLATFVITKGNKSLPMRWEYSFDNWKTKKKYTSPWKEEYIRLGAAVVFSGPNKSVSVLNLRAFAAAEMTTKWETSASVLGYTSKGCPVREFALLKSTEEFIDCYNNPDSKYCRPVSPSIEASITCIKGKDKAVITGLKPKCPPGYRKS